jgi:hypothetical protein
LIARSRSRKLITRTKEIVLMVLKKAALVVLTVLMGASGCSVNVGLRKTDSLEEVVLS